MKNVLIIVPGLGPGGQEKVAVNTAIILSLSYNIYFCVFSLSNAVYKTEFDIIDLDLPSKPSLIAKIINVLRRSFAIKKVKRKFNIDITLSFGTTANILNAFSKASDKTIVSVRGYESVTNKFPYKLTDKLVYRKADRIICVAKKLSQEISSNYSITTSKIKTLYNPYDFTTIEYQAKQLTPLELPNSTIVSMGRLENVKGYCHLLNSFKIAKQSIPNLHLVLIGTGTERKYLEQYASKLGVFDCVYFIGFQDNPHSYLSKCSLYVLSSIYEGFPNALVEAMACSLPVVATDCKTGPREILSKEYKDKIAEDVEYSDYGVLVPPFSSDNSFEPEKDSLLAKAIVEILTNSNKYNHYRQKSLERAKQFSTETYKAKLIEILKEV